MTDTGRQFNSVAPLRNVVAMVQLMERVMSRAPTLPGMAVFYGPSGYGKSTAATYAANTFDAYTIQAESTWTKSSLCENILLELGLEPRGRIDQMARAIYEEIAATGRPLIIDEADHIVARGLIELVRDIYEKSEATIILIGEEKLPRKLTRWERVHGRILNWVAAEPAAMADVSLLADIYCEGVTLDETLKELLLEASHHSMRRVSTNLADVRLFAQANGLTRVSRKDWGDRPFHDGQAPRPRGLK
jgi:DNA transposition AAA+ family ATPase